MKKEKPGRLQIVAGNWKMNLDFEAGRDLIISVRDKLGPVEQLVVFCPPFIHLKTAAMQLKDVRNVKLGAQNCHQSDKGAFTGEVSAGMLRSVGCEFVILGHSERREFFGENEDLLAEKLKTALKNNLRPIFCCGEKLESRDAGTHTQTVENQLSGAIFKHFSAEEFEKMIIAYEPVWAIGTGRTATPEQAQEMHAFIRQLIKKKYGGDVAEQTSILYGGSCKASNARELFAQPDVDGGLIGGASLDADEFVTIANSF